MTSAEAHAQLATHSSASEGAEAEALSGTDATVEALTTEVQLLRNTVAALQLEQAKLIADCAELRKENDQLCRQSCFGASFLQDDDVSVSDFRTKFLTGLPNFAAFLWLAEFCISCLPTSSKHSARSILLLTLMKLNLNLKHQDLAWRFEISISTASYLINKAVPEIANKLKFMIRWPSKSDIFRIMLLKFKDSIQHVA